MKSKLSRVFGKILVAFFVFFNVGAIFLGSVYAYGQVITTNDADRNDSGNYKIDNNKISIESLIPKEPTAILPRGGNIPTSKHNVWKADYHFNGGSYNDPLYSAKRFYGKGDKSKYYLTVQNTGKTKVHVMCKHEKKTYLEFDVDAGKTAFKNFDNIYPSTEWYLRFSGKGSFAVDGWVK